MKPPMNAASTAHTITVRIRPNLDRRVVESEVALSGLSVTTPCSQKLAVASPSPILDGSAPLLRTAHRRNTRYDPRKHSGEVTAGGGRENRVRQPHPRSNEARGQLLGRRNLVPGRH